MNWFDEFNKEFCWKVVQWLRIRGRNTDTQSDAMFDDLMIFARENHYIGRLEDDTMLLDFIGLGPAEAKEDIIKNIYEFVLFGDKDGCNTFNKNFCNRMCLYEVKKNERKEYRQLLDGKLEYDAFNEIRDTLFKLDIGSSIQDYKKTGNVSFFDASVKILPAVVDLCKSTIYYSANYENYKKLFEDYTSEAVFKIFLGLYDKRDVPRTQACTAILLLPLVYEKLTEGDCSWAKKRRMKEREK